MNDMISGYKCNMYQPCQYWFAGMCMYPSNMGLKPCKEYSVGTCETDETMMQKETHEE